MSYTSSSFPMNSSKRALHALNRWNLAYNADALPEDSGQGWSKSSAGVGATEEISPIGNLHLTAPAGGSIYYTKTDSTIDNSTGFTFETRVKVIEATANEKVTFSVSDATNYWDVSLHSSKVVLNGDYIAEAQQEYAIDLTDDYHIIRATVSGTTITVYVDGVSRLTGTANSADGTTAFYFGKFATSTDMECYIDRLHYKTDGALAPS